MLEQFSRTALLLGEEGMERLKNSKVAVFGIGGVGGHAAEALARSGVGRLDLVDNDRVSITNINRQMVALLSTVGRYKTEVAKDRIADINPDAEVNCFNIFFTPENSGEFDFSQYDYVIDAIDTVTGKIELAVKCVSCGTPIISSMGAGNKLNPAMFEVADIYETSVCPLARVMRYELKKRGIKKLKTVYSKEKPLVPCESSEVSSKRQVPGSTAFCPSVVGLIIAGEVVGDIAFKNR